MTPKKSQTSTEYMIIVAIVIVIALVVVQLIGGFPGISPGTSKKVSDYKLEAGDTVGISDYYFGNGYALATLKSNHYDTLQIVNITIRGVSCTGNNTKISTTNSSAFVLTLNAGQSITINCTGTFNISHNDEGTPSFSANYIESTMGTQATASYSGNSGTGAGGGSQSAPDLCAGVYTQINSCQTISSSGCYQLNQSINATGNCFTINADNVTLNLNGFTITGDNSGNDYGIYSSGYNLIIVENGKIEWFGKNDNGIGLRFNTVTNSKITNIDVTNNGIGLFVYTSSNNNFSNINSYSNTGKGIYIGSQSSTLDNIKTYNNLDNGIWLSSVSNSIINNLNATGNTYEGLYIAGTTTNSSFYNTIITNNGLGLALAQDSNNNTFYDTKIYSNAYYGINFGTYNNTLVNPEIYDNTNPQIDYYASGNVLIFNNTYGEIKFSPLTADINSNIRSGATYPIQISNNLAYVDTASITELNISAIITLKNLPTNFVNPVIKKNGVTCGASCYNFTSLNAGTVVFNVSSWSNYSIAEGP